MSQYKIYQVKQFKYFAVNCYTYSTCILDDKLNWKSHIVFVAEKIWFYKKNMIWAN